MRFVFPILLILCTVGGALADEQTSNYDGQIFSLYMENAQKTASKIMELKYQLPLFLEVAKGQKDLVLSLLEIRQLSQYKDKIIESMFSYNAIVKLVESQFFINLNYRTDEDEDNIVFKGKFFLSNYINMYWLNKMGLDDEASLKLVFSYFMDPITKNILIEKGVLNSISPQYLYVSSLDLAVIRNCENSQKKYQSELSSNQLIKKRLQESFLFMNMTMYSQEKVLKKYQEVFTKIEPYFFIFTTQELDSVFKEVMELTLSELHEEIMIENTIFEALYNRTSILIDPNSISLGFQEIDQYMISAYFEKKDTAMPFLLQFYKDVHVQLIEIPEDQYENLVNRIAFEVNQSEKQVQTKIIKSSLSLKHIELLIKSNCLQNEGLDEIKIIFKDKKYLLSLVIEIQKNLKDGLPYEDAIRAASLSLISRVGSNQFYRIVQNLVGKRMLLSFFNGLLDPLIKLLPKGVYNTIASAFFQKDVGGGAAQNAFRKILRTEIVSSSLVGGLFIAWDSFQWMRDEISNDEFIRRIVAGVGATTFGTLGGSFGMALGPVGSVFGAVVGGGAGYVLGSFCSSYLPKSDIEILANTIADDINFYSRILYEQEIKIAFQMFKAYLKATYEFKKYNQSEESCENLVEYYRDYVQDILINEVQGRQPHCSGFNPESQL